MHAGEWLGLIGIVVGAIPLAGIVWRAIVHRIVAGLAETLQGILRQVTPNGGNSGQIGDRVQRIESEVTYIRRVVDQIQRNH